MLLVVACFDEKIQHIKKLRGKRKEENIHSEVLFFGFAYSSTTSSLTMYIPKTLPESDTMKNSAHKLCFLITMDYSSMQITTFMQSFFSYWKSTFCAILLHGCIFTGLTRHRQGEKEVCSKQNAE